MIKDIYCFRPEDQIEINARKMSELLTKITFGVRNKKKTFKVIVEDVTNGEGGSL